MKIYALDTIWGHRQPSIVGPVQQAWQAGGYWEQQIHLFVRHYFYGKTDIMGITREIAKLMMLRWFLINKYTYGFGSSVALEASKVNFQHFMSQRQAGFAVPMLVLAAAISVLAIVWGFFQWLEGTGGNVAFKRGRVLMRYNEWLWWGNLVGRPSQYQFDFAVCTDIEFTGFAHKIIYGEAPYGVDIFDMHNLWQTVDYGLIYDYVYTWRSIKARFRGVGHRVSITTWRMSVPPGQEEFWQVPIGWQEEREAACAYLTRFEPTFLTTERV